jgi:hypothetical protein
MIVGEFAFVHKRLEGSPTAFTRLDREAAARLLRARHNEILKEATCLDVRLELGVRLRIARPPHVARRSDELVDGNGCDHVGSPDESRCSLSAPVAHRAPVPFPLSPQLEIAYREYLIRALRRLHGHSPL